MPFISVLLPVKDCEDSVLACLNALGNQTYERHLWELIVVDRGSRDGTEQVLKNRGIFPMVKPGPLGRALNTAVAATRGEVLAFISPDIRPYPEWLSEMAFNLNRSRADALMGNLIAEVNSPLGRIEVAAWQEFWFYAGLEELHMKRNGVDLRNAALTRRAFENLQGFSLAANLDLEFDFNRRLIAAECKVAFCSSMQAWIRGPQSLAALSSKAELRGRGAYRLARQKTPAVSGKGMPFTLPRIALWDIQRVPEGLSSSALKTLEAYRATLVALLAGLIRFRPVSPKTKGLYNRAYAASFKIGALKELGGW